MSKTQKITPVDFEHTIMTKVKSNEISMKPRWYFVLGSLSLMLGFVGFSIGAVFLTNLTFFLYRRHGPMGEWRLQHLLTSFPWWVPMLAVLGLVLGVLQLRKYDFSYKKNFSLIILGFIFSVLLAAFVIDQLGLNDIWSRQGPMRRFYQQIEEQNSIVPKVSGQGQGQGRGRFYQLSQ